MDTQRLNERIDEFIRAVRQLERALAQPFDEFIYDERLADAVYAFARQEAISQFQALAATAQRWKTG